MMIAMMMAGKATEAFYRLVPFNQNMIKNLNLDHTDKSGYWFSFELVNDNRRQTFAVRYSEL